VTLLRLLPLIWANLWRNKRRSVLTILVLGAFASHQGYLNLELVILCAFIGTVCGDQLFFFLGRNRSERTLEKHPQWQPKVKRVPPK